MRKLTAPGWLLAFGLINALPAVAAAQNQTGQPVGQEDNTSYGTTSAEFLLLGAGARGTALGSSFAAIATDVSALYYNPAGVAMLDRPGLMIGTYDYVADTRYSWGGVAFPFSGGARTLGFQLGTFGFKDQPIYTEDQPNGTGGTYSVNQTFVGATFAQNFSDRFSAGITAKYVNDRLGTVSGSAFAVDFGTNFHASLNNHPVKFSFVLANLGSNLSYSGTGLEGNVQRDPLPGEDPVPTLPQQANLLTKDFPLPTTFRVGLAYDVITGENSRLTALGDFNQPNNNKPGFAFGSEWQSQHIGGSNFGFALRGSYSYTGANNLDPQTSTTALSDEENLQGLAFGGGLMYGGNGNGFGLSLDYAYKYLGILGPTNFFSFSLGW
ncbi:MAG TPA: PorV/PorQ family protein [Gemmatimonadales bacterium]|nr:PorV/PorQ family protein [Gemmatimonadales bacterium]